MKWVIATLLVLNLWLGVYGFGQTYSTLNVHRELTATELSRILSELEAVQELLFSLDATYSDEYMELIKQRYIKLIESDQ